MRGAALLVPSVVAVALLFEHGRSRRGLRWTAIFFLTAFLYAVLREGFEFTAVPLLKEALGRPFNYRTAYEVLLKVPRPGGISLGVCIGWIFAFYTSMHIGAAISSRLLHGRDSLSSALLWAGLVTATISYALEATGTAAGWWIWHAHDSRFATYMMGEFPFFALDSWAFSTIGFLALFQLVAGFSADRCRFAALCAAIPAIHFGGLLAALAFQLIEVPLLGGLDPVLFPHIVIAVLLVIDMSARRGVAAPMTGGRAPRGPGASRAEGPAGAPRGFGPGADTHPARGRSPLLAFALMILVMSAVALFQMRSPRLLLASCPAIVVLLLAVSPRAALLFAAVPAAAALLARFAGAHINLAHTVPALVPAAAYAASRILLLFSAARGGRPARGRNARQARPEGAPWRRVSRSVASLTIPAAGALLAALPLLKTSWVPPSELAARHMQDGMWYEERGEYGNAASEYRKSVRWGPRVAAAHVRLGVMLLEAGDPASAESHFKEAAGLDPKDPAPNTELGFLYIDSRRPALAREYFGAAIAIKDANPMDHVGMALAALMTGDRESAIREVKRALALDPDCRDAKTLIEKLKAKGAAAEKPP